MTIESSFSGSLIAIGGNEDKSENLVILKRVIQEVNKSSCMVGIITTASDDSVKRGREYHKVFTNLGASKVELINIKKRSQANDNKFINKIEDVDLIFLTGGDQLRLTSVLGGSLALQAIQNKLDSGALIAGTSAGAAAFSDTMIYEGSSEEGLFKGSVLSTPGFGFVKRIIFDTHFMSRGRIGRLVQIITTNPVCIGVGISEDSGVVIKGDGNAEVIGTGQVIIVDGRNIKHSNIMDIKPGEPISVENVRIHSLVNGYGYDFKKNIFIPPIS